MRKKKRVSGRVGVCLLEGGVRTFSQQQIRNARSEELTETKMNNQTIIQPNNCIIKRS
jgi:hypothetical protein